MEHTVKTHGTELVKTLTTCMEANTAVAAVALVPVGQQLQVTVVLVRLELFGAQP